MLYLIRHCAATGQAPEAPLTDEGYHQAAVLAAGLAAELAGARDVRIVSSPYRRALDSVQPLAARLGRPVHADERLRERVLSTAPCPDWRERLRLSFEDLDRRLEGGESSREAMARGVAAVEDARRAGAGATIVVTHGNLLTLLLRHFDGRAGFAEWRAMGNPEVFRL